ncbi:hypothetical protein EHS13_24475 [Paenibacillus psychroresistens]|uniref:Copper amine oxidase-like N-terminal domain-containing protein n=1 Tax=Paenibacillus psychroresistens TaxID=1778678 RepID=A0A6B8RRB7_9BACL|nr:hypothetical protein [Paenibacillus psychroresistens]QGQ97818.1 hypothetical protein EHS13_24475 [Paenibacillus psychroresistens]
MKKIVLGMLIGIGLSLGFTAYADDIISLIGKKVEGSFPLLINNVRADKDVLVIDSTSYLPVRSAAALFGYDVSFNADLMVILTKKNDMVIKNPNEVAVATPIPSNTPSPLNTPIPSNTPSPLNTPIPTPSQSPAPTTTPTTTPAPVSNAERIDKIKVNIIGMNAQIDVVLGEIKKNETLLKSIQSDVNQAAKIQSTKTEITRLKAIYADFLKQLDKLNKSLNEIK